MAHKAFRHSILALAVTGLLGACVQGPGGGEDGGIFTPAAPGKRAAAGADVEAPEVFQVTDTALWDGRPSLGGIWVASADAVDPERVMMENVASGKSVEGALFRRERDNPGPALQLSSDAAEALGILAGQPAEIRVTALRRAEPEVPVEEVPAEEVPAEELSTDIAAAPVDPAAAPVGDVAETGDKAADEAGAETTAAVAAAALAAAEGAPEGTDPALAETGAETGADAAVEAAVEAPKKTWKERRAEAKAAREAKKAAAAAEKAAAAAEAPLDGATVDATGVAEIETAPLDARAPEVSAAAAAATEDPPQVEVPKAKDDAAATAEASPDPAADTAEAAAPATTARSIQIASFSQEENATRAVDSLAKIGVTAQVRQSEVGGKAVWGIIAVGDAATLKKVRGAGFPDAYFLQ